MGTRGARGPQPPILMGIATAHPQISLCELSTWKQPDRKTFEKLINIQWVLDGFHLHLFIVSMSFHHFVLIHWQYAISHELYRWASLLSDAAKEMVNLSLWPNTQITQWIYKNTLRYTSIAIIAINCTTVKIFDYFLNTYKSLPIYRKLYIYMDTIYRVLWYQRSVNGTNSNKLVTYQIYSYQTFYVLRGCTQYISCI